MAPQSHGFIKSYMVHRPCETTLDASFREQGEAEDQDLSESRPDTPSAASTSVTASSLESLNEGASPTAVEETASTASTDSARGEKRKRMAEIDIELQKLKVLQKMATGTISSSLHISSGSSSNFFADTARS